jgi:hypothetical protein
MEDIYTEKLRVSEGLPPGRQSTSEVRVYEVYTPDAGHLHGEAQGPRGSPGRQSTPEVREYIVDTKEAGHLHGEAQGP